MLSGGFADRTGQPLAVLPLTDVAYPLRVKIPIASQVWNFCPNGAKIMRVVEALSPFDKKFYFLSKVIRVLHRLFCGVFRLSGPAALRVCLRVAGPPAVFAGLILFALFHAVPPFLQNTLVSAEKGAVFYQALGCTA